MDRFESMSVLLAAVESGSLSKAGRQLGLPLATVSRRIADLETQLKAKLFVRSSKGLTLTPPGRAYATAAQAILEQVNEAERAVAGEYAEPRGDLIVTAPTMLGRLHMLPVAMKFLEAFPDVSIDLSLSDRIVQFPEDQVDIALRVGSLVDSGLIAVRVGSLRQVICASPGYLAAAAKLRSPADLERHRLVAFGGVSSSSTWSFWSSGDEIRVTFRSRLSVTTIDGAIDAALADAGIVRAMSYQVVDHIRRGRLVPLLEKFEPPPPPVHLVYGQQNRLPLKMRSFVDFTVPRLRARLEKAALG